MFSFGELETPMLVDLLPEYTEYSPLRSCHLKVLLPNTEQVPFPSDFLISGILTFGDYLLSFGFHQRHVCLVPMSSSLLRNLKTPPLFMGLIAPTGSRTGHRRSWVWQIKSHSDCFKNEHVM